MKKTLLVVGPALSRSGYGEQCRFALRSLRHHEDKFDIYLNVTNWGKTGWLADDSEERDWMDSLAHKLVFWNQQNPRPEFDISLQVTIPNEFRKFAKYNIGYTAGIETTQIAPEWVEPSNMMDKIIVVSNHSKQIFENTVYDAQNKQTGQVVNNVRCTTPVEAVNYPVRVYEPSDAKFNLETDFNFLMLAQGSAIRKNMNNTIKWFTEEFHENENVGLIVKTFLAANTVTDRHHSYKHLKEYLDQRFKERKCKVYLLHGEMTDEDLAALYQHEKVKALVSLAHGEGFGLPLFEAAYYGLPVICPDWSGQCDFLYAPTKNKKTGKQTLKPHFARVDYDLQPIQKEAEWAGVLHPGSMWCYPKKNSYKSRLRDIYKDHKRHLSRSKKLRKYLIKEFVPEKMYDKFVNAMHIEFEEKQEQSRVLVL